MADGADDGFAAFSMRPLPGDVTHTVMQTPIPFAMNMNNVQQPPEGGTGLYFSYQTWWIPKQGQTLYGGSAAPYPNWARSSYTVTGFVMAPDNSGARVLEGGHVVSGNPQDYLNLFANGNTLYHHDTIAGDTREVPIDYTTPRPNGIETFLIGLKLHGAISGDAMKALLTDCGATQLAVTRDGKGLKSRQLVYSIDATDFDRSHSYNHLRVTVRLGDYQIQRTELELPWGTERTDYHQIAENLSYPASYFQLPTH